MRASILGKNAKILSGNSAKTLKLLKTREKLRRELRRYSKYTQHSRERLCGTEYFLSFL